MKPRNAPHTFFGRTFFGRTIVGLASLLMLAACGGGGGGGPVTSSATTATTDTSIVDARSSYGLEAINAVEAHRAGWRGAGATVAVIDGEMDITHPEFHGAFLRDDAGQVIGRNVRERHNDVRPVEQRINSKVNEPGLIASKQEAESERKGNFSKSISHATHVSGIIAARHNGFGVTGVAPEATLLPIVLFRDYYVPREHRRFWPRDPRLPNYRLSNERVTEAVDFARANDAFVINNSWGRNRAPYQIKFYNKEEYYPLYDFILNNDFQHADVFHPDTRQAWIAAAQKDMAIVFAAGNDRWNSETGEVPILNKPINYDNLSANEPIRWRTTHELNVNGVPIPENIPSLESSYFLTEQANEQDLKGRWITVVATDKTNKIASFSNGCGAAKHYCVAAPGSYVLSTMAVGDEDDKGSPIGTKTSPTGDVDWEKGDGLGTLRGTSMAAPFVSGALAVLKSRARNITARQAVKIILCTATQLRATKGNSADDSAHQKNVDECLNAENMEATQKDGWEPSEVYGHGLLNLERALAPAGRLAVADGNQQAIATALTRDTRLSLSAPFGDSAAGHNLLFGSFDMFNRSYTHRAPISAQDMTTPALADMLAWRRNDASVDTRKLATGAMRTVRWSNDPASKNGAGQSVTIAGARHDATVGFVNAQIAHASMMTTIPADTTPEADAASWSLWPKLTPKARDITFGNARFAVGEQMTIGAHFHHGDLIDANKRTANYGFHDLAMSAVIGDADQGATLRVGRLVEQGHFLGAKAEGGYALARGSGSNYMHATAHTTRGAWRISAAATQIKTRVDFAHNSFVDDTYVTANEVSAQIARAGLFTAHDRLGFGLSLPLAIRGGAIRQQTPRGYTADGGYNIVREEMALRVQSRHRAFHVDYQVDRPDLTRWFVAASVHDNWGNQRGRHNVMLHAGLMAPL